MRRFDSDKPGIVGCDFHGVAHVVEIVQRLAHAHQHDIGDFAIGAGQQAAIGWHARTRPIADAVARQHNLADDFLRFEIAHQALGAGMAERAIERAADLAGDAQRAAIALGDVDGFDFRRERFVSALGQPQQPLARAIDRDLLG